MGGKRRAKAQVEAEQGRGGSHLPGLRGCLWPEARRGVVDPEEEGEEGEEEAKPAARLRRSPHSR
jgi:hypothetical protein